MDLNVFLYGGGTRLSAHLGALKAIEEQGGRVVAWAGASAGSILGAVLASGCSREAAKDLLLETDFRQFLDLRLLSFWRGYGLYAGTSLERWLERILDGRRFGMLAQPLAVICTDILRAGAEIFSTAATPDALIAPVVRCSVGIPGLFAARHLNGNMLIDGCLASHEEHTLFPDPSLPSIIIRLVRDRPQALPPVRRMGFGAYIEQIAAILLDALDAARVPANIWRRTLVVNTGPHSPVNFRLTRGEKEHLFQMGYQQALKYFSLKSIAEPTG